MRTARWLLLTLGLAGALLLLLQALPDAPASPDASQVAVIGRLVGPSGAPVGGVRVELVEGDVRPVFGGYFNPRRDGSPSKEIGRLATEAPHGGRPLATSVTDPQGRFRFEGAIAGERTFVRLAAGSPWAVYNRLDMLRDAAFHALLQVGPALHLHGRVVDAEGKPVRGFVSLSPVPPVLRPTGPFEATYPLVPGRRETAIAPDGTFRSIGVSRGGYEVIVRLPGRAVIRGHHIHLPREEPLTIRVLSEGKAAANGVVRSSTGAPLPGARVLLVARTESRRMQPWQVRLAHSDERGRFRIEGLPEGRIESVSALKDGYVSATGWHKEQVLTGTLEGLDLVLGRGAAIHGVVRDEQGRPVGGALVETTSRRRTRTGPDGRYRITGLPLEPTSVSARTATHSTSGDSSVRLDPWRRGPPPGALRLTKPGDVVEHDLTVHSLGAIEGRVVDEEGRGAAGVLVEADPRTFESGELPTLRAMTDAKGRFRLGGTVPGMSWRLRASGVGTTSEGEDEVKADQEGATPAVEISIGRTASVAGRVLDPDGKPVAMAYVWLQSRGEGRWISEGMHTDREGRFQFEGLARGAWSVSSGGGMKSRDRGASGRVELDWGETRDDVTLEREGIASIGGTVVGPDGTPRSGVVISLESTVETAFQDRWHFRSGMDFWDDAAVTDERGRFRVHGLRKREWWIRPPRKEPGDNRARIKPDELDAELVFHEPTSAPRMVCRVRMRDGTPIGRLSYSRRFVTGPSVRSYGEGCGGDRVVVDLRAAAGAEEATLVVHGAWDVHGRDLGIAPSKPVPMRETEEPVEITVEPGLVIRGRVLDTQDNPVPNAPIGTPSRHFSPDEVTRADADGRFEITGLAPDRELELIAMPPAPFLADGSVKAKAGSTDVILRVRRGSTLEGRVVDSAGEPVWKARVSVPGERDREVETDRDGRFRITALDAAPGKKVQVDVERGGVKPWPYMPWNERVVIGAEPIEIRLEAGVYVAGTLIWPSDPERRSVQIELRRIGAPRGAKALEERLWGVRDDEEWSFRFGPLKPGDRYTLTAKSYDDDAELSAVLEVTPPAEDLKLRMEPPARVRLDLGGESAAGFYGFLLARRDGRVLTQPLLANAAGDLVVEPWFAGPYTVYLARAGDPRYALLEDVRPSRVSQRVRLRNGRRILGAIEGPPAAPVPHRCSVTARRADGVTVHGVVEDAGRLRISGLPPGDYRIDVVYVSAKGVWRGSADGVAAGAADVRVALTQDD